jgi:hypothetical protein
VRLIRNTKDRHRKQELRQQAAKWLNMAAEMERAEWPVPSAPKPKPKWPPQLAASQSGASGVVIKRQAVLLSCK